MKNLLWATLLLVSCHSYAQSAKSVKDTLIWTDGTKYAGTIIKEDQKTGQVQFMTEDSQMHQVSSSAIAQLKRANAPADNKLPPVEKKYSSSSQGPSILERTERSTGQTLKYRRI